jgi:hypothetical protein
MNKTELAQTIFRAAQPVPHGFPVELSEDEIVDPQTGDMVVVHYLLFKNSLYQRLSKNRQKFVDVARWLKTTHDAMRSVGLRPVIQPIFDGYDGLTPDQLKYKLQEIINKK